MKVTAVSVTYGNRFHLVDQIIDSLVMEKVDEIWIVDNDSHPFSKEMLLAKAKQIPFLKLFSFSDNLGSAGAYYEVLNHAFSFSENQFFWFLDDDNFPLPGALNSLLSVFEELKKTGGIPVLYSYRGQSWEEDRRAVNEGYIKGPKLNSFCGFVWRDLFNRGKKNGIDSLSPEDVKCPIVPVQWGPYGGLFTTLDNLKKIGFPKKEMVVYADDQEYTYRFHLNGINQFLIYSSQIQDIDQSIGEGGGYFNEKTSLFKLFYGLRNTTYLSRKMVTKPIVYFTNKSIFLLVLCFLGAKAFPKSPKLVLNRMSWFLKALKNGERGMLGKEASL